MKGDIFCIHCKSRTLKVIYQRDSISSEGEERHYGQGRRKQRFTRIGAYCTKCGSVFFDKFIWDEIISSRKEEHMIKSIPSIKLFIYYKKNFEGRLIRITP